MADAPAPTATESTDDVLSAYARNLPKLGQVTRGEAPLQARADLALSKEIAPQQQALINELYKTFAPELAATGANIDAANRKSAAAADVDILDTSGRELSKVYSEIDRGINPEYYSVRESAGKRLNEILGESLDSPNIEAERLINQENIRSGTDAAPSATTTTANALQFGDERQKRVNNLSNAISTATGFLAPASNQAFNPATTILNRPTSNTGQTNFGKPGGEGDKAYQQGSQLLDSVTGLQQTSMGINANRRDVLDRFNEVTNSL